METKEKFKKLGHFWLPSTPNEKVPGILSISDAGHIVIEVIGEFGSNSIKSLFNAQNEGYTERIVGHIETDREHIKTDGRVTLDGCYFIGPHVQIQDPHSLLKFAVFADRIFIHEEYGEGKIPRFKNFIFSLEGIDEWSEISNFRLRERDEKNTTMSYQVPTNIPLNLNNGMQLFIKFPHTHTLENRISPKTYFELFSKNACELDEFISVAEKIRTFLCFAINEIIPFASTSAALNDGPVHMRNLPLIDIYDSRCLYFEDGPKINRGMLFKFENIQSNVQLIINKWIEICEDINPALDSYFTAQKLQYLTATFLTLVQGLEVYHRRTSDEKQMDESEFEELVKNLINQCPEDHRKWLKGALKHSNDVRLRGRLKSLSEPFRNSFQSNKARKELIHKTVEARNNLIHEGKLESEFTYRNLIDFCLKLFQSNLLQLLSFSHEAIDASLADSIPLRQRPQLL